MKKYFFSFFLLIVLQVTAQNSCPLGYIEGDVKCNGAITRKCIPENYSCKGCWHVIYGDCNNSIEKSIWGQDYDSYQQCLHGVREVQANHAWMKCQHFASVYRIYLKDSKFCDAGIDGNSAAINDLKNKIIPFLKRYKAEISNYRRYFSGKPYKPGAVVKEYEKVIKQGEQNANKLEADSKIFTDQNLSQIEAEFEQVQKDEITLQQSQTRYNNYLKSQTGIVTTQEQLNHLRRTFDEIYKQAGSKLSQLKQGNPQKTNDDNETYWTKLSYYQDLFLKEYNKGSNANPLMLNQYVQELNNMAKTISSTDSGDKTKGVHKAQ